MLAPLRCGPICGIACFASRARGLFVGGTVLTNALAVLSRFTTRTRLSVLDAQVMFPSTEHPNHENGLFVTLDTVLTFFQTQVL